MNEPIHILSLGAGVQSSTLALMAARGEVGPMPSAAVFADTQAEPAEVYRWLDWLEKQLPFPVIRVTAGSLTKACLTKRVNRKTNTEYYSNMIPAFVKNPDGTTGLIGRHCTADFKLDPIIKQMRKLGGVKRGQREVAVISWIGISLDEVSRMKPSRVHWIEHRWPLIKKEFSRHDCLRWMKQAGYPTPPRSACIYCPFHSNHEWKRLKESDRGAFEEAAKFEKELQEIHATTTKKGKITGIPFLHRSMKPIGEVEFDDDPTQGNFGFINECEGMCGV